MERTHKRFKLRSSLSPSTSRSLQVQPLEERRLMAADLGNDEGLLAEGEAPRAAEVSSQLHFDSSELVFNDMPERRIVNGQETAEFDAVGIVNNGCTGTLISPTHVLTAAHCTVGATPQQMSFQVGGETYQVSAEFTHPQYNDAQFDAGWDLAIMELDRPVEGVEPMQIMRAQPEIGETLTIVGFGEGGTDTGGSSFDFGTKRVGTTPLEEVTENHLWWTFDAGESNTAPGDSGGPAFIEQDGQFLLAGVTSGGESDAHTLGDRSFDTRIDNLADWIDGIVGSTPTDPPADPPMDPPTDPPADPPADPPGDDGVSDDHSDVLGDDATHIEIIWGLGLEEGTFETSGDMDVFAITLDEPSYVDVLLYGVDDAIPSEMMLFDADAELLAESTPWDRWGDAEMSAVLDPGIYYIVADMGDADEGTEYYLDVYSDPTDGGWFEYSVNDGNTEQSDNTDADHVFRDEDWMAPEYDAHDCNQDGYVSALDALMLVNHLNSGTTARSNSASLDVNGDEAITALDALMVINELNQQAASDWLVSTEDLKRMKA